MCLDPALLPQMAAQGTALTPTLAVITAGVGEVRQRPDGPRKDWYLRGAAAPWAAPRRAAEAGVTILAGTDSLPHGRIADEVRALVAAGVRRGRHGSTPTSAKANVRANGLSFMSRASRAQRRPSWEGGPGGSGRAGEQQVEHPVGELNCLPDRGQRCGSAALHL